MRLSRFLPIIALSTSLGAALVWAKISGAPLWLGASLPAPTSRSQEERAPYDPNLVHKTLEFYAKQVKADPGSAISLGFLANQYLENYRETGDSADALRAEQAARRSLRIRTNHNGAAYFALSRALLTQHRFGEALAAARQAAAHDPIGFRECADIEIELGDYEAAARDLAKSPAQGADPAYLALAARFSELHGETKTQIALLLRAVKEADANPTIPVQSVAWFHERLGRALSMAGRRDEAKKTLLAGLHAFPRDYRTMAALAHLSASRLDWKGAIQWGEKAAQIVPAPETLALMGDAYAALGQPKQARTQWKLVEDIGAISRSQGIIYDRQRALFLADRGLKPLEAVQLARGELRFRHDIYTNDTLGWTLFKAGRVEEAAVQAKRALRYGTRDALLWFHAGEIAAAQGKTALARGYLKKALAIDPQWHPTQPQEAKATLRRLSSSSANKSPGQIVWPETTPWPSLLA